MIYFVKALKIAEPAIPLAPGQSGYCYLKGSALDGGSVIPEEVPFPWFQQEKERFTSKMEIFSFVAGMQWGPPVSEEVSSQEMLQDSWIIN